MIKRIFLKFVPILIVLFGIFVTVQPSSASAGSKTESVSGVKEECVATTIGKRCKKYRDYTITAKWTKSDANEIANKISTFTGNKYGFVTLVVGYVNNPVGLALTLNGFAWNTVSNKFYTAQTKGTGITYKYVYRLYQGGTTTTSGKVVSSSWVYK